MTTSRKNLSRSRGERSSCWWSGPRAEVEVRTLKESGYAFLDSLAVGRPLGAAYESACAVDPGFDLEAHLAGLLAGETFASFRLDG